MPPLSQPPTRPRGSLRPAAPHLLGRALRRPGSVRPLTVLAGLAPAGTVDVDPVGDVLRPLFQGWPEEDLWICAVSLADGRRVVFGRDERSRPPTVAEAVTASCAIPGYYRPAVVDGERLVDGGVRSVHSLDLLAGRDLDLVIVSAPMATTDWIATDAGNAARVAVRAQVEAEARVVRRSGTPVVVLAPDATIRSVMGMRSMDVTRRAPVARCVRAEMGRRLREDPGLSVPLLGLGRRG